MAFIATHWYFWLGLMAAGYGYAIFSQLRRMKEAAASMELALRSDHGFGQMISTATRGLGKSLIATLIGAVGTVLLIIAIIINVASAIK